MNKSEAIERGREGDYSTSRGRGGREGGKRERGNRPSANLSDQPKLEKPEGAVCPACLQKTKLAICFYVPLRCLDLVASDSAVLMS